MSASSNRWHRDGQWVRAESVNHKMSCQIFDLLWSCSHIRHDPNIKWPITGCLPCSGLLSVSAFTPTQMLLSSLYNPPPRPVSLVTTPAPRDESCHEASDWSGWGDEALSLVKCNPNKECVVITSCERRQFDPVYPELSRASSSYLTRIVVMSCTNNINWIFSHPKYDGMLRSRLSRDIFIRPIQRCHLVTKFVTSLSLVAVDSVLLLPGLNTLTPLTSRWVRVWAAPVPHRSSQSHCP